LASTQDNIGRFVFSVVILTVSVLSPLVWGASGARNSSGLELPVVLTQLPRGTAAENHGALAEGTLRSSYGDTARIVLWRLNQPLKVLTEGFHSACDPSVSFDGKRLLFSGKKTAQDDWNIYEMGIDGSGLRSITSGLGDCRSPSYQSTLYTLISVEPWYQITFVGEVTTQQNELGMGPCRNLYSCKLDGSGIRQLTYNLSGAMDPVLMSDGRLLFASWQRATLQHGPLGHVGLFGINIDGADYAIYAGNQGKRIQHMPCATTRGLVVFVEAERVGWDGAGTLGSVRIRRPLYTYRTLTQKEDGLFHSPAPLPDGTIVVSRRSAQQDDTHGVYQLDPTTGEYKLLFDDPQYHDIQAQAVYARPEPDGRSSVVSEKDPYGKLYCLNVYMNDLKPTWLSRGNVKRLRVIEGLPTMKKKNSPNADVPRLAPRRILGDIPIQEDGSFNVEIPASIPIELQILDAEGMALRTCSWIWAKNHEPRGCIGCHEDPELTPENFLVDAMKTDSIQLTLPSPRRRTVIYTKDVQSIVAQKCVSCHQAGTNALKLTRDKPSRNYTALLTKDPLTGRYKYVQPGSARTSWVIWQLYGRNTSRPWDRAIARPKIRSMPPAQATALTEAEKQTIVEWIDLGAMRGYHTLSDDKK
jgi:hydrazine synthase alpha subunit-like protein